MPKYDVKRPGPQYVILRKEDAFITLTNWWLHVGIKGRFENLREATLRAVGAATATEISYEEFMVQMSLGLIPSWKNKDHNAVRLTPNIIKRYHRFFIRQYEW